MSVTKDVVDSVNVLPLRAMLDWKYDKSQLQQLRVTLNVTRGGQVEVDNTLSVLQVSPVTLTTSSDGVNW